MPDWRVLEAIKELLTAGVGQMILEAPGRDKDHVSPQVRIMPIDLKRLPPKDQFPLVAIHPVAERRLPEERRAEVSLVLGVYSDSQDPEDGMHDLGNLVGMVEATLIKQDNLKNKYLHNLPMDIFSSPVVRHPYYLVEIVTRWQWFEETNLPLMED